MKQNKLYLIKKLEKRIKELEELFYESQDYKNKCDEMGKENRRHRKIGKRSIIYIR